MEAVGWLVLIGVAWMGLALAAGVLIGRGIRRADENERDAVDHQIERELHWASSPAPSPAGDNR
jgi:hypothetical protein